MDVTYYHGTDADFETVDPEFFGVGDDDVANCRMGLWVAQDRELAQRFGGNLFEVTIPERLIHQMSIATLSRMHREAMHDDDGGVLRHVEYAERARARGAAALSVVEQNGSAPTAIIVNLSAVTITKMSAMPRLSA
jgi:hypothetical protein